MLCYSMIGVCGKYLYDYFAQSAENRNSYADIIDIGFPDDADNQDKDHPDNETEEETEVSDFDYDSLLAINSDCKCQPLFYFIGNFDFSRKQKEHVFTKLELGKHVHGNDNILAILYPSTTKYKNVRGSLDTFLKLL